MGWNDLIGRQLGSYQMLEEIGRGGSSRVYRGIEISTQTPVAVKVIPNEAEDRVGFVRRFEREVRAVAQLDHPNIVRVFDRGETDDLVYLVMQYVGGGTLRQRLGRSLPIPDAVSAIIQMAYALHHAHQRGIVHRDVKPSNMLLDANDSARILLTDFGIAKLQGLRGLTKSGTTIGTPEYMAPEQAEGKEIDQRADVYSLGCVLYETLAGRTPFIGSTSVSILYQQVHQRPAYLRGFNSDVPRDLARVVEQALSKRPEERFGTAETFAQALLPFAEDRLWTPEKAHGANYVPPVRPLSKPLSRPLTDEVLQSQTSQPLTTHQTSAPEAFAAADDFAWPAFPQIGLGAEGLDALFPNDRPTNTDLTSTVHSTAPDADAPPPPVANEAPETLQRPMRQTIPLPAFRLPTKQTRPLNLPLTDDGELDMDVLLKQVEAMKYSQQHPDGEAFGISPLASPELPWQARKPMARPAPSSQPSGAFAKNALAQPRSHDAIARPKTESDIVTGMRHDLIERDALTRQDTVRQMRVRLRGGDGKGATAKPRGSGRFGRRRLGVGLLMVAILVLALAGWGVVSASGLLVSQGQGNVAKSKSTPTLQPTATTPSTATATTGPTFTATTNPQQQLNQEAAASFRAVTLATFDDRACGFNQTYFSGGQSVVINLCSAANPSSGPMSVAIEQHGAVVYRLTSGVYLSSSAHYWYARYSLPAGTYDMVVTLQINGQSATARDIRFTVG